MFRGILLFVTVVFSASFAGCKTTATYTKVDKNRKYVSVYSTGDERSAMVSASDDSTVTRTKADLKKALQRDPHRVSSWLNLAKLYLAGGELKEAEEATQKALRLDFRSKEAKLVLAQINIRKNRFELAEILLNDIGGVSSQDSEVINLLALIALSQKDTSRALNLFKTALEVDPSNVSARMNLGVLNLKYRQLLAASVQFERVLKIMPEHTDAKLHLAIVKASKGNLEEAKTLYKQVLSVKSNNPLALYNLAVIEKNQQNYADALDHLKTYLKTAHAKTSDTDEVFAMIEEIKDLYDQQGKGGGVSDEEIQSLASDLEERKGLAAKALKNPATKAASTKKKAVAENSNSDDDDDEDVKRPTVEADEPAPLKQEEEPVQTSNEIEDLERALLK